MKKQFALASITNLIFAVLPFDAQSICPTIYKIGATNAWQQNAASQ